MKKALIALVLVSVLLLACGEEGGVTPKPGPPEPTTPAYVLKNVELSFNQRDIGLLKVMLSENFVFHFDPRDVGQTAPGGTYIIPESWSYTEFWQAVNRMFTEAYSIDLEIPTSRVGTPGENETTYFAENITLSLLVYMDEMNGFIADKGYCNFEFERYEAASGKKYWRLINWWDRTSAGYDKNPGASPSSLGRILAIFN